MDFGKTINLAWRIVKLEKPASREAADDPQGLFPTLLVIAIGGALSSAGGAFFNPAAVAAGLVLGPIATVIMVGIYHLIALAFGGKATFGQYLQSAGLGAGLVSWIGVIPFIGGLIQLWAIPTMIVSTEEVHSLDRTKAVLTILIPAVLALLCCCAVVIFAWGTIVSAIQSNQFFNTN